MTNNPAEIIATVNTRRSSLAMLRSHVASGATLLRLNGAFIRPETLGADVTLLRTAANGGARVILDLPGYKLRLQHLERPLRFTAQAPLELKRAWLNYPEAFDLFEEGGRLRIRDGRIVLTVDKKTADAIICTVSRPGVLTPGTGVHLEHGSYRPSTTALSQLDHDLVAAAVREGIECVGLSFTNSAEDVAYVQRLCRNSATTVVPKIESKESVKRTGEIVEMASEVIIDRGDLAGEIGLDKIWRVQREIIATCKRCGVRVYAATQVMSSMIQQALPSIADIDSLYSLIHDGVDGVQLSEETSVGRHAGEAIRVVREVFEECQRQRARIPLRKAG
jgi:pyruvate kinase